VWREEFEVSLIFEIQYRGDTPVVVLAGRITNAGSAQLKTELEQLRKENHPTVLVDISKVNYIDSYGLGVLAYFHNGMEKADRIMIIINQNHNSYIARLFEMTRLDTVFRIVADYPAVEKLRLLPSVLKREKLM
jgi:anti-anti-sigma factor